MPHKTLVFEKCHAHVLIWDYVRTVFSIYSVSYCYRVTVMSERVKQMKSDQNHNLTQESLMLNHTITLHLLLKDL